MKIVAAAIQMPCDQLDVSANVQRADDLLRTAFEAGVELAVLPELFNTGYSLCPDYGPYSETPEGPTVSAPASAQPPVGDGDRGRLRGKVQAASLRLARFLHT